VDEFSTVAKLWPAGTPLNLGTDTNLLGGPATFTREAAPFETDGVKNFQFLFWNTGRHITNKRRVRWNFSVLGWGVWTATRWYGIPGKNGGVPRVRADAFSIGADAAQAPTPIDGAASTFAAGAWPFNGDDHVIGTAAGAATVVPKDPYGLLQFAGWVQLIWGGDSSGEFVETDVGSGGSGSGFGVYDHVVAGPFPVAKGASADLLATYGTQSKVVIDIGILVDEILSRRPDILDRGDPSPIDFIRLKLLEQLVQQTRPGAPGATDFQRLIDSVSKMSKEELQRAVQSVQTSLDLGKTALSAIKAQIKRGGG
jgi:hypothetical protein